MKPEKEHLPFMGVGPVYVGGILTLTAAAIFLSRAEKIPVAGAGALHAVFREYRLKHKEVRKMLKRFFQNTRRPEGCGGGANLAKLLAICPAGNVTGVDYSPVSVEASAKKNKRAVDAGHCHIVQGDVSAPPFKNATFDLATAFETIYFWPDLENAFRQVLRVLRPGGSLIICNQSDGINAADGKWVRMIDGMKIYKKEQLIELLKTAGFTGVTAYEKPKKHWLCITAIKAQSEETVQ